MGSCNSKESSQAVSSGVALAPAAATVKTSTSIKSVPVKSKTHDQSIPSTRADHVTKGSTKSDQVTKGSTNKTNNIKASNGTNTAASKAAASNAPANSAATADTTGYSSDSGNTQATDPSAVHVEASGDHGRFASYASGASSPPASFEDESGHSDSSQSIGSGGRRGGNNGGGGGFERRASGSHNPKSMVHSTSAIGLDQMIEDRREDGDLHQNIVHIEVPFGKPIEEVYDGVHNGPVLGSGISGLVRLVTHKATGLKYAVKVLDLGLVETSEGLAALREEVFIMCQLDHPNIVRLEEVYESHSEIYLVQELCLGGELFDRLDEQPDYHYTEGECARLVKQMLSAVRYLHSKGIIHRDLKLENFLFSSTAQDSELKMIDFGLSKHFRYGEVQHEAVGTPYTVAPEVIKGSYDERCDIWAIGVITFLLLSGDPPFGGCGGPEPLMTVRSNILRGSFFFEPEDIWQNVSSAARQFIKKLLVTDPKSRPTAREAQMHTWLKEWASRTRKQNDNVLNPNVVKALVNFKEFSDMRKLLCEVLSFTLLPYQIKDLRREFEKMDTDGSGEISLAALKQVLMTNAGAGSLGALTEEEVEDIFNAMRVRKTETRIHWHEFIAAGLSQCQVDDRNLRLAFDRLDSDHKGYITLDDIMDLMGSDALQSEDAMRRMWGDSIRAVKCQRARITYDDFLLLMKGQTKEAPSQELELGAAASTLVGTSKLHVVPEVDASMEEQDLSPIKSVCNDESENPSGKPAVITLPSGDRVTLDGKIFEEGGLILQGNNAAASATSPSPGNDAVNIPPTSIQATGPLEDLLTPSRSISPLASQPQSCPTTPADHKRILDLVSCSGLTPTGESPQSTYDSIPVLPGIAGPGVPGSAASLTPPQSPMRGVQDYVTPSLGRRITELMEAADAFESGAGPNLLLPGLPGRPTESYKRRQSRSSDDKGEENEETPGTILQPKSDHKHVDPNGLHMVADAVRDLMLPETDHTHHVLEEVVKDETQSALVVNRKLYRAHRQMRLAVLEASKRFEEQQARHAHQVILAHREEAESAENSTVGMIQAGLVMRHGHTKQVSSEAIRKVLQENRLQQLALVEKANRRGGRGRRSRKKTISDMSGMLGSRGQDEMGKTAAAAIAAANAYDAAAGSCGKSAAEKSESSSAQPMAATSTAFRDLNSGAASMMPTSTLRGAPAVDIDGLSGKTGANTVVVNTAEPANNAPATEGTLRAATVPGEFRKTQDPFSKQGKYGAVAAVSWK